MCVCVLCPHIRKKLLGAESLCCSWLYPKFLVFSGLLSWLVLTCLSGPFTGSRMNYRCVRYQHLLLQAAAECLGTIMSCSKQTAPFIPMYLIKLPFSRHARALRVWDTVSLSCRNGHTMPSLFTQWGGMPVSFPHLYVSFPGLHEV